MKNRQGFVSNSSSSSFIIMHHADVKCVADAEELLPECIESFRCKHGYGDKATFEVYTRQQVADWIFRDMKKLTVDELKKFHIQDGYYHSGFDEEEMVTEFTWEEFYSDTPYHSSDFPEQTEKDREETAKYFHFYAIEYGDEGSWGNFMEHHIAPMISIKRYSHH